MKTQTQIDNLLKKAAEDMGKINYPYELKKKEFILPEKWSVKPNNEEERKIIVDFFNERYNPFAVDERDFYLNDFNKGYKATYYTYIPNRPGDVYYDVLKYPLITFYQFKKYFLKQSNMKNKKIIGYKFKDEFNELGNDSNFLKTIARIGLMGNQTSYPNRNEILNNLFRDNIRQRFENARLFDLWFEPIYESELKIGDYVWSNTPNIVKSKLGGDNGFIGKLIEIDNNNLNPYWVSVDNIKYPDYHGNRVWCSNVRKATPEEIIQAQKHIIKMYSFNYGQFEIEIIDGEAFYRKDNKKLPKEWIAKIIKIFDSRVQRQPNEDWISHPYEIITNIVIGCMEGTRKEDWLKVYKLLK